MVQESITKANRARIVFIVVVHADMTRHFYYSMWLGISADKTI